MNTLAVWKVHSFYKKFIGKRHSGPLRRAQDQDSKKDPNKKDPEEDPINEDPREDPINDDTEEDPINKDPFSSIPKKTFLTKKKSVDHVFAH